MNAIQTFDTAASMGVHFVVQGEAVIATPASLVTNKLHAAIDRHRHALRKAVLAAQVATTAASTAKTKTHER